VPRGECRRADWVIASIAYFARGLDRKRQAQGEHRWARERETGLILENVRRYLAGSPLLNVVDQEAGY
jgi:hypothetical protein